MARLFTCGFEENDITAGGSMWDDESGLGTLEVQTSVVRSGTYALRRDSGATSRNLLRNLANRGSTDIASGTTLYFRVYLYVAAGTLTGEARIMATFENGTPTNWELHLTTSRELRLTNTADSQTITSSALNAAQWYRVEVRHLLHATTGELELRIDGASVGSLTGINTRNAGGLNRWRVGGGSAAGVDLYLDDLAVNDGSGAFENSWPGDGKIALLTPNSDVSVAWTRAGSSPAATNFGGVDDVPGAPNNGTDYNEDSGQVNVDRLGLSGLPTEVPSNATIRLVDVWAKVGSDGTTNTRRLILKLWDEAGAVTDGPNASCDVNGWQILRSDEHLVYNASGKTKANLDSFDVRVSRHVGRGGRPARDGGVGQRRVEGGEEPPPSPAPDAGTPGEVTTEVGNYLGDCLVTTA